MAEKGDATVEVNAQLSLAAEALLHSVDPDGGPLLAKRSRLRDAVLAARELEGSRGSPRRELLQAGVVQRKGLLRPRLKLSDRAATARRFNAIKDGAMRGRFADERDQHLFVLLAGAGVLARRFTREEARMASQRLDALMPSPSVTATEPAPEVMAPEVTASAVFADHGFGDFAGGPDSRGGR